MLGIGAPEDQDGLRGLLRERVTGSMEIAVGDWVNQWLIAHPLIHWLVDHPLSAIALFLILLILLLGLLGAIARSSEQFWLMLLKSPFHLLSGLVRAGSWAVGRTVPILTKRPSPPDQQQEKLRQLLERLDSLRQEQEAVLAEVRSLLK